MVTNLYKLPPYDRSQSLSCFAVLINVPRNWRLLLLSEEHTVERCFIVSGMFSAHSSHAGGWSLGTLCPCMCLLWLILNPAKPLCHWQFSQMVFGDMYYSSVSVFNHHCEGLTALAFLGAFHVRVFCLIKFLLQFFKFFISFVVFLTVNLKLCKKIDAGDKFMQSATLCCICIIIKI